jgi:hypothetical protein
MKTSTAPRQAARATTSEGVRFEGCVSMVQVDHVWSNLALTKANDHLNARRDEVMRKAKANAVAMFGREIY